MSDLLRKTNTSGPLTEVTIDVTAARWLALNEGLADGGNPQAAPPR